MSGAHYNPQGAASYYFVLLRIETMATFASRVGGYRRSPVKLPAADLFFVRAGHLANSDVFDRLPCQVRPTFFNKLPFRPPTFHVFVSLFVHCASPLTYNSNFSNLFSTANFFNI